MFSYEKRLQYPVKIANPNPALAKFIISQYGGPDGVRLRRVLRGVKNCCVWTEVVII